MISSLRLSSLRSRKCRVALYALTCVVLAASLGCRSKTDKDSSEEARGIIIVNAPAAGVVRRVLVSEGMVLNQGAPVVEIIVRNETQNAPQTQTEDPVARAGQNIKAADAEIEAARAEVVRYEVEVQRLTPLVASGDAPQAQLDGARADYERAQQRLQRARDAAKNAQDGLVAARQPSKSPSTLTMPEQIVVARATSAGTVSAINAKVGQQVTAGQPLATLRADGR